MSFFTDAKAEDGQAWIGGFLEIRWILKILHDPRYLIPWELWDYSTFRSCRSTVVQVAKDRGFR